MAFLKDLIVQGASRFIGDAQGSKFIVDGATSSQFLKGDGTLDSNTYLTQTDLVQSDWNQTDTTSKDYIKNKPEIPNDYLVDYSKQYLTFEALENGTFQFTKAINYSIDGGTTWTTLAANTATPTILAGNKILWKAELIPASYNGIGKFSSTGNFNVEGNIMSLLYGDDFVGQTNLTGKNYAFYRLFEICEKLINVKNLSLPAITLASCCYYAMFQNCSNLTTAPELPATILADFCYQVMFNGCTSLTVAPELPATTLAESCYGNMFENCTSLTTAPELPATILTNNCYSNMFCDCTNLTSAPELPAITLANDCYAHMFTNCINLTIAPKLPATTLAECCYIGMFEGCTSLTAAPELPAIALVDNCYESMFDSCTSLNYIKAMFTTTPSTDYTSGWVDGVAASGTFIKNGTAIWNVSGVHGIPEGWTVYTNKEYEVARHYELSPVSIDTNPKIIKTELLNNNELEKVLIPIDSLKNNYNGDQISKDVIIPYISDYQSYLVLEQGKILKNSSIIVEANLIGKGFYSNSSILTNNNLIQIYSTLPLSVIKDNLQYLTVTYYNNNDPTNLFLWFDDFPGYDNYDDWVTNQSETDAEDWQDYVRNYLLKDYPNHKGANCYKYTGEMFEWEGEEYYLWESLYTGGLGSPLSNILTDTIDYEELYNHSLEADYTNSWCPYIIEFDTKSGTEPYNNERGDILIKVSQDHVIQDTWIYTENKSNNKNYEDWDDYCTNYLLNLQLEVFPNCYEYTGETIEWNGNNYYLWNDVVNDFNIITDTINYNELYNKSIESDHYNMICPYVAMLDSDTKLKYEQSERKYDWLVKVVEDSNNPGQAKQLYIDDFYKN